MQKITACIEFSVEEDFKHTCAKASGKQSMHGEMGLSKLGLPLTLPPYGAQQRSVKKKLTEL